MTAAEANALMQYADSFSSDGERVTLVNAGVETIINWNGGEPVIEERVMA